MVNAKKEYWTYIALVLATITFMTIILEIYFISSNETWYGEEKFLKQNESEFKLITWYNEKNFTLRHYRYEELLNNESLRGPDTSLVPEENITRIIVLGDSFTFGIGLESNNLSMPKRLEHHLNEENENTGKSYEVLNFGIPGANMLDLMWAYKYKIGKYNPDIVIYAFYQNDLEFGKENIDVEFCRLFDKSIFRSEFVEFVKIRNQNIMSKIKESSLDTRKNYMEYYTDKNYYGWECLEDVLKEMDETAKREGYEFTTFSIPSATARDLRYIAIESLFYQKAEDAEVDFIPRISEELYTLTKDIPFNETYVDIEKNEHHYGAKINDIISRLIMSRLKQEYLDGAKV